MSEIEKPNDELDLARLDLDQPGPDWSYAEWEAYRLRRENDELRGELDRLTGPTEAHRHALRWATMVGALGAEFALAIALSGTVAIVLWVVFAANLLSLFAYGMTMSQWRDARRGK